MSSDGDVAVAVAAVAADSTVPTSAITVEDALCAVLRTSMRHDGLSRGLRETVKALERKDAELCVLAESCDEKNYVRLIEALCAENDVPLIKIPEGKKLGEWTGLCKIDKNGEAQKVINCSVAVVRNYGEETQELSILLDHFKRR
jgi:small subunit ribosomal protein S12e